MRLTAALALMFQAFGQLVYGAVDYTIVAREGAFEPQPGSPQMGPFVSFDGFGIPAINSNGETSFRAFLIGQGVSNATSEGIWRGTVGNLQIIARAGFQTSDPQWIYNFFEDPRINDSGTVAFYAAVRNLNNTIGERVILVHQTGVVERVAASGNLEPGPGLGPGVQFISIDGPYLNSSGDVAFPAGLVGVGIGPTNHRGIWTTTAGPPQIIAREGSTGPGPGLGPGVTIRAFIGDTPFNGHGDVLFHSTLDGTGVDASNQSGMFLHRDGQNQPIARQGSQAPTLPQGVLFEFFGTRPRINQAGDVAFVSSLRGTGITASNDGVIWAGQPNNLQIVAREGDPAPGAAAGSVYDFLGTAGVISDTAVAFRGGYQVVPQGNTFGEAIWSGTQNNVEMIAGTGASDPGPGLGPDVYFAGFGLGDPSVNAIGQVAFTATVRGPGIGRGNDEGLWATDPAGQLQLVIREGDLFDLDRGPGSDLRQVSSFAAFFGSGNGDGLPNSFNDRGELAFIVGFPDGVSAIVVATVPEPSTTLLAGFAIASCVVGAGLRILAKRQAR